MLSVIFSWTQNFFFRDWQYFQFLDQHPCPKLP